VTLGEDVFDEVTLGGVIFGSVNADRGAWPTSIEAGRGSMERRGGDDRRSN